MNTLERFKAYEHKTFGDAAELYLAEFTGKNKARQEYALAPILTYIADSPLLEIDDDSFWKYKQERCLEVMAGTVNKELTVAKTVLNKAARDWRWMPAVPIIRKVTGPVRQSYPLTHIEQRRLIHQIHGYLRQICLFALNTGVRREELFALKWDDECKSGGVEYFAIRESVNHRVRPVVLNSVARKIVQQMDENDADVVFVRRSVSAPINNAWVKAGLPDHQFIRKGINNFRHTYAHRLRLAGASETECETLLGLRYGKRERQYSVVDLKRLEDLAELTITVKEPDLPVYLQVLGSQ